MRIPLPVMLFFVYFTHTDAKVQRPCHMPDLACHCNYIPALSVTPIPLSLSPLIPHTFQLFPIFHSSYLSHSLSLPVSFVCSSANDLDTKSISWRRARTEHFVGMPIGGVPQVH